MTSSIEAFEKMCRRYCNDVRDAAVNFDFAWVGNKDNSLRESLKNSFEAHGYEIIFRSQWERSVSALLRSMDDQKGTASIQNILQSLENPQIRAHVRCEILGWPGSRLSSDSEAEEFLSEKIHEMNIRFNSLAKHKKALNRIRNTIISHSNSGPKGKMTTYGELLEACALAGDIAETVRETVFGEDWSIEQNRRVVRNYARRFWETLSLGMRHPDRKLLPPDSGID